MNNYVSPEAYNNKNLVSSSDTYSLGLIMYQLLNKNRLPFVNLFVKNKAAVEARMEGLEIPNLKRRNQELMQIIIKACSKDAANRYKETYLMRDALQKLLDSGSLNNENDLSGNNQQNLGKTISIYDNQNIVPLNLPINKNSATQTKQQELKGIKGEKVRIVKVDVDKHKEIAAYYQIQSVPTLMIFKDGKQLWRQSGVMRANDLSIILAQYE